MRWPISRRSNCAKTASTLAIASPAGVVVSTAQSSATSAHPCFLALPIRAVKSIIERDSRSNLATTIPFARPSRSPSATIKTPYPPEFRAEAIRLVKTSGDPLRQIAKDLGVSDQTLRNWVKQDDVDAGRKSGLTSDERSRLRELERENRKLREEREILRKAAAFFAGETGRR